MSQALVADALATRVTFDSSLLLRRRGTQGIEIPSRPIEQAARFDSVQFRWSLFVNTSP
jgi:hypothetical protein